MESGSIRTYLGENELPVVEREARAYYESGDLWRDRIAYLAMPIMLWCAKNGRKITYGQLAEEIERRHGEESKPRKTLYGLVAGKLGTITDLIGEEWGRPVPPINALVVNKDTQLPSSGVDSWLEHYLYVTKEEHITDETRDAVAQMVIDDVFDYTHWDAVAEHLGISRLPRVKVLEEEDLEPIVLPKPVVIRGGGESEQHRQLKEWVASHPERFAEFGSFRRGQMEVLLHSGDEVDVLFANRSTLLVVEVKAANAPDSELRRGLFQCVKYKAVLRATRLVQGESPTAQAILVTQRRLPEEIAKMARRLGVRCLVL